MTHIGVILGLFSTARRYLYSHEGTICPTIGGIFTLFELHEVYYLHETDSYVVRSILMRVISHP
jgi:hypothetical protein